jgi:xanthine dehydrogenase YagR molybdenum-binding subunit
MTMKTNHIGKPYNRVDGPAKVTGAAKYTAEYYVPDLLHGYVMNSAIAKGRITSIDASKALAVEGVVQVFSHENVRDTAWLDFKWADQDSVPGHPFRPFHSERILFSMQPIVLVVAESFELARYATTLIEITYEEEQPTTNLSENLDKSFKGPKGKTGWLPPAPRGDAKKAFEEAPIKVQGEYIHGAEHNNPMEMFASIVVYEGDGKLTIYDKTQGITNSKSYVTGVFKLNKNDVRILSPYVGGGFGSGLRPQYQLFMATLAALELKRSVKVSLTRQQMFSIGHRPKTVQRLAFSADREGYLQSMEHVCYSETSQFENYTEIVVNWSGLAYQCKNSEQKYELVALDTYTPIDMRAPGSCTAFHAVECIMDDLAYQLKMDPLEFRIKNYAHDDQNMEKPFTSKELMKCYTEGAAKFGWEGRPIEPRSMREGNQLVGWGVATGVWDAAQMPSGAKAVLGTNGHLEITSGTSDIGTGTYTAITQIAADTIGLPFENVTFTLGDTLMPVAPLQGGSWTVTSVGSAVKKACEEIGKKLLKLAKELDNSPLAGHDFEDVALKDGYIVSIEDETKAVSILELMAQQTENIEVTETSGPDPLVKKKYSLHSHNATFVEVKVDEDFGTIKVTRVVSAIAGGRIINAKTARSQILGGVVWGISQALEEDTVMDHNFGRFINHDFAEYHIPVNADINQIDVIFVDEVDGLINPLGAKGLGEIGLVGVAGAIANAVFHATGKRYNNLPIHLDHVM